MNVRRKPQSTSAKKECEVILCVWVFSWTAVNGGTIRAIQGKGFDMDAPNQEEIGTSPNTHTLLMPFDEFEH